MEPLTIDKTNETALEIVEWTSSFLFDKVGSLEVPANYTDTLLEVLALLSNPTISKKLPEHYQDSAGEAIKRLIHFFHFIESQKEMNGLFDKLTRNVAA